MTRGRLVWCALRLAALGLVSACSDNTPVGLCQPPVVAISPSAQWSGGEIQLTSEAFTGGALPVLLAGAETLAVRRISDSIVAATVPLGASGSVPLELAVGRSRYPAGTVTRVGFHGTSTVTPGFYGELLTTFNGGTPIVVGTASPGAVLGPIQSLDLGSMQLTSYPGIFGASYYGVSPTPHPSEFVVQDSLKRPLLWRLWPTPALVDSPPSGLALTRQLARFSDSVWVLTSHHYSNTYRNSSAVFPGEGLQMESPWMIYLSPRGDRATFAVGTSPLTGVPVFNSITGDTAYSLGPGFSQSQAAAFSPDGDRIFFLGGGDARDSLLSVRASTGAVLAGTRLPDGAPFNMAADPAESLVYVETLANGQPTVLVYDYQFRLVGRLPAPAIAGSPGCSIACFEGTVSVDRVRNQLHLVWTGATSFIWTYDLLPAP